MTLYMRPLVRHQKEVMTRKRHQLVRQYKVVTVYVSWFHIWKKSWTRKKTERDTVQCHHRVHRLVWHQKEVMNEKKTVRDTVQCHLRVHRFGLTSERSHGQEKNPERDTVQCHHRVHRFGLTSTRKHEQEREISYAFNKKSSHSPSVWFDIRKKAWTRKRNQLCLQFKVIT